MMKILLLVAVVVFLSVLWARKKVNITIEPLENNNANDAFDQISRMATDVQDSLNITTYNEKYQDLIIEYDKYAGLKMIDLLKSPDKIMKNVNEFNAWCDFKKNLNVSMAVLDKS
jgi:hypothetical protein